MNQSIGCGPLPFASPSDKAVIESATATPALGASSDKAEANFNEVLESEIEEDARPRKEASEDEALAAYGIASIPVQLPPVAIALSNLSAGVFQAAAQNLESASFQDHPTPLPEKLSSEVEASVSGAAEPPEEALEARLETLKLAEQKVPSLAEANLGGKEQIAENPTKPAKIAYGMVAAQGELMVSDKPKQEETALEQNLRLSAETFGDGHLEQPIASKPVSFAKESPLKRETDFADLTPFESFNREWSSFEGISDASDLRPVKGIDEVEFVEAIRTHVQLLKGSSQEKLDVVLRPDGQTELRLHVEKVNGQILVQARCDRGDFARLEANWTAVQQTLANQGVRVEALEQGTFSQSSNQFQNPSGNAGDERTSAEYRHDTNFIEQKSRATKNPQPVLTRDAVQGWQSWA